MTHNPSYRVSFVCALIFHLVLFSFLFVKFSNNKSMGFSVVGTVINVTAINEKDFDNQMRKKVGSKAAIKIKKTVAKPVKKRPAKKKPIPVKRDNKKLHTVLKKNMLKERERELEELKKERQKRQKELLEAKELELQQKMQEELAAEEHGRKLSGTANKHKTLISQAIQSHWHPPPGMRPEDTCVLIIEVAPEGTVLDVRVISNSGGEIVERLAKTAVLKASPLPMLEGSELLAKDREIQFTFRDEGIEAS